MRKTTFAISIAFQLSTYRYHPQMILMALMCQELDLLTRPFLHLDVRREFVLLRLDCRQSDRLTMVLLSIARSPIFGLEWHESLQYKLFERFCCHCRKIPRVRRNQKWRGIVFERPSSSSQLSLPAQRYGILFHYPTSESFRGQLGRYFVVIYP